ncbi:MAG TPA: SGNH/GDSL hydrolase family protein [Acidimicrobiales bacterium]
MTLLVASPSVAGVTVGSYVALGDSYASGQGLAPFVATTPASCDRSTMSYPYLLASSLGLDVAGTGFRDATCAGAQLGNLATSVDGAPAQLSAVTAGTDLVTLNAGGNDANFVTLAATCVQARAFAQFATLQQQRCGSTIATVERFLGVTTSARPVYASVLRARYPSALVTMIMGVLSAIRAAQGPFDSATGRATVLAVVNYPVIFPPIRAQAPACQVGVGLSYSARDAATLRAINVLLNQEIAQAANRYVTDHHDDHVVGVNVANALRPLSCHLAGGNSDLRAIDLAHLSYSLHPLASGQAKIANAIHASLMARAMLMRTGHALRRAPH